MKAKLITELSGKVCEGEHQEPHGTLQHVVHMPHVGVICQIKLGGAGLQYKRPGMDALVIQTPELIKLFETLEPALAAAPADAQGNKVETRPAQVDDLGAAMAEPH
jgi:hypothetical protein